MTWEEILAALDAVLAGTFETPEAMAAEVATIREQIAALLAEASEETAEVEEVSAAVEGAAKAQAKLARIMTIIQQKKALNDMKTKNASDLNALKTAAPVPSGFVAEGAKITGQHYRGKAFKQFGSEAGAAAYKAGRQIAACLGDASSAQWCKENGVPMQKTMATTNNSLGGLTVVDELDQAILYYREERGVARGIMDVVSMNSETRTVNRNVGGTAVYALGEGQTYTESDVQFSGVQLTAKKFGALTQNTIELGEDSYAAIAEEIAKDHGYAHAVQEDKVAFLGDGTSTYNNLVGLTESFKKLVTDIGGTWATDANKAYAAGVQVASGATLATITLGDIIKTQAKVATFPGMNNRFYTPSQIWYGTIVPLIQAVGGNTATQIVDGVTRQFFNGSEVVFTDELYTPLLTAENSQFVLFYGDAAQAGLFGDRRGLSITSSQEVGFLTDTQYNKSTARYGVNWWNIGNASTTASARQRGALAALVTKNS
jgi:HK97 family phage major capsid protein